MHKHDASTAKFRIHKDICIILDKIMEQLAPAANGKILIKSISIQGTIPFANNETIGKSFPIKHILGLSIEDALITCIQTYIDKYVKTKQNTEVAETTTIKHSPDNNPRHDFTLGSVDSSITGQIKAIYHKNAGGNEMNAAIREGVGICIAVVYDIQNSDVIVNNIQVYVPDANKTYNYISKKRVNKQHLCLDSNKSFITIK